MHGITLQQLRYFDAVVAQGSFHAAAAKLHRSHPTLCAALSSLEQQLGFELLDRKGYRVALTDAGRSFHERVRQVLRGAEDLQRFAELMASSQCSELRVVMDDGCVARPLLATLKHFLATVQGDSGQLKIDISRTAVERLHDGSADVLFYSGERSDTALECTCWGSVDMLPVAAPGYVRSDMTVEQLVHCVVSDRQDAYERWSPQPAVESRNARQLVVAGHQLKRDAILQRMAWGYLPSIAIADDLRAGRLVSLASEQLCAFSVRLWAARLRQQAHATIAAQLWSYLQTQSHEWSTAPCSGVPASATLRDHAVQR